MSPERGRGLPAWPYVYGARLRRLLFELWYRLRRPPWDTGVAPAELRAVAEGELAPSRAIDLGCGTGTNVVYLAQHGWEAVGLDFSWRAIELARRKARDAGVAGRTRFIVADVTRPPDVATFDLALDMGCFHSLSADGRERYVAALARMLRAGAAYLLYAFRPAGDGPGVSEEEVRARFTAAFEVLRVEEGAGRPSAWYRLRRR